MKYNKNFKIYNYKLTLSKKKMIYYKKKKQNYTKIQNKN